MIRFKKIWNFSPDRFKTDLDRCQSIWNGSTIKQGFFFVENIKPGKSKFVNLKSLQKAPNCCNQSMSAAAARTKSPAFRRKVPFPATSPTSTSFITSPSLKNRVNNTSFCFVFSFFYAFSFSTRFTHISDFPSVTRWFSCTNGGWSRPTRIPKADD